MDNFDIPRDNIEKAKNFFSGPKIIFTILGLVILIEVIYAVRVLTSPTSSVPPTVQKAVVQTGKISLMAPKTTFAVNESVPVSVVVDTGGHEVDGVDAIVHFDPLILEATTAGLVKGNIFTDYPLMSVDSKKGLITISGVSSLKSNFKGTGQFATVNLKAKAVGNTTLSVDFSKKGATIDSNLVEANTMKDILEQVDNLGIVVQ